MSLLKEKQKMNNQRLIVVKPGRNFTAKPISINIRKSAKFMVFDTIEYRHLINEISKNKLIKL